MLFKIFFVLSSLFLYGFSIDFFKNQEEPFSPTNVNISNFQTLKRTNMISQTGSLSNTLIPIEGWNEFRFGIDYDKVITNLSKNRPTLRPKIELFSEFEEPNKNYLETYKNTYLHKVEFQFSNDKLYLIRILLNQRYFSFLKIYERLYQKYGPPQQNSFNKIVWNYEENFIELNRRNVLTYYSRSTIENSKNSNETNQSSSRKKNHLDISEEIEIFLKNL